MVAKRLIASGDMPHRQSLSRREFVSISVATALAAIRAEPRGIPQVVAIRRAENPNGADVDIIDTAGNPMFRVLLPESVAATNVEEPVFGTHTIAGNWIERDGIHCGRMPCSDWAEIRVALLPRERGVLVVLGVHNPGTEALVDVEADVCVSVSHLPCPSGDWINPHFLRIPSPPERSAAGRFWYEHVAPTGVKAFCNSEWLPAHAHPDAPSGEGVPSYQPFRYLDDPASIIAAESLDGHNCLLMAWDVPSRAQCVFPGNSCMHLHPRIASRIPGGQTAFVRGEIALTHDSWQQIAHWNAGAYREKYERMEEVLVDGGSSKSQ